MIRELLFVHHTHTDIGYTHPQPVVFELHRRFLEQALDLADATADWPEASRFRWTCEVTGTTLDWWERASERDRGRFLAAAERGQLEVAAMAWHMTPLMDHAMLRDALRAVRFFRDLGLSVRSAMNTDVNGLPWGMVDALLDHGITGLSMAINEHYGHALAPWPLAFRWEAPGGRRLTGYNGLIYGVTSDVMLRVPVDLDEARERVPAWARLWEGRGYAHPFLMLQVTQVRFHDNGSPNPALPDFVRRWNEGSPEIGMRFVTLSEFFDRLRAEPEERLPVLRGDWTDWWNFGAGSTAAETAQAMEGQRHLVEARGLDAWGLGEEPRRAALEAEARRELALYCEHTWGADRSIARPGSPETRSQLLLKLARAPQGASLARLLRRDGLERLAASAGGEEPRLLVYNPNPFPLRRALRLPALSPFGAAPERSPGGHLADFVPHGPESHRIQRQDVVLGDTPDDGSFWTVPVELEPFSYVTMPAARVVAASEGVEASGARMANGELELELDLERGGVASLRRGGREYARALDGRAAGVADGIRLGVPVHEAVVGDDRDALFAPIDFTQPDWHESWRPDWEARRTAGTLVASEPPVVARGAAHAKQTFELPNGDRAEVTYRLAAGEVGLELVVELHKTPDARPHGVYLPLPVALDRPLACHFETAGAVVRLDDEQLPYASRHYVTTQRWIRLQGDGGELTVATPDAPLWQVGGFTFGRFGDPDGRVPRPDPLLLAWLTNNYWMTNFQADQSGVARFRFWLLPGDAAPLGASVRGALAYVHEPAAHVYGGRGEVRREAGTLLQAEVGELLVTAVEPEDGGVALELLNPSDEAVTARFAAAARAPVAAERTSLSGAPAEELPCENGEAVVPVEPRAWTRVRLRTADAEGGAR